jgi:glycosyltransferase involved in cell wall biosynthesis
MEISYTTAVNNLSKTNGFGVAGYNLVVSLQSLGHRVTFQSETAPVEIAFCQPDYSDWSNENAYHIQYTPWESTKLRDGWMEAFNDTCDEVWATSPWVAQVYKDNGVTRPIYVYEHGVEKIWTPKRRRKDGPLKYIVVGEPAPRKNGQLAFETFIRTLGDKDATLTIKAWHRSNIRVYKGGHIVGSPHMLYDNVNTIYEELTEPELVKLYHDHDVMIYLSTGEGFGLIPLQAMATGMPVICVDAWAPYKHLLLPELKVSSSLGHHPWQNMHPGEMFIPHKESIEAAMVESYENFDRLAGKAYKNAFLVHEEYDWTKKTEEAFDRIIATFS